MGGLVENAKGVDTCDLDTPEHLLLEKHTFNTVNSALSNSREMMRPKGVEVQSRMDVETSGFSPNKSNMRRSDGMIK
jgi:hypothetical protein